MNSVENTKNNTQNASRAEGQNNRSLPKEVTDFLVRKTTATMESDTVKGYDFNKGIDYPEIIKAFAKTGFQSTSVSHAIDIINKMLSWRLSDEPFNPVKDHGNLSNIEIRKTIKCTIFLGYTSNLISSGMRETIRFLVEHKLVNCIVTSGKGIEEDFMKCLAPTHVGDFQADDHKLYEQGVNRIGNLLIPSDNYSKFKDWILPLFDEMLEEQQSKSVTWTPSKLVKRLGEKIDNPESVYYWAAKNDIPVFCTGFTDGILGEMLFMHSSMKKGFVVDIIKDLRKLNKLAMNSKKSGVVILGGGLVKDHILNSNIVKNGADYTVLISNENEYDSGNSGLQEALSCGKLNLESKYVKVWAESTLVFPIIVAETFAKYYYEVLKAQEEKVIEAANGNNSENTTSS